MPRHSLKLMPAPKLRFRFDATSQTGSRAPKATGSCAGLIAMSLRSCAKSSGKQPGHDRCSGKIIASVRLKLSVVPAQAECWPADLTVSRFHGNDKEMDSSRRPENGLSVTLSPNSRGETRAAAEPDVEFGCGPRLMKVASGRVFPLVFNCRTNLDTAAPTRLRAAVFFSEGRNS